MAMLALMMPPLTHVKAVPAMMPLSPADLRSTIGLGGRTGDTITVAEPEMAPLVARTVFVNVPANGPAVKRPELGLIDPPPATTDQTGAIGTILPDASRPTAANCWKALGSIVAGFGVTVIVASTGDATVTVTVAVPEIVPLVALTVLVNVPAVTPAVKTPVEASIVPPPLATDHTGVMTKALPPASVPVA